MGDRIERRLVNSLSAVPLGWVVILYVFTALCWIELGHFPVPSLNDPKDIGYAPIYFLAIIGMLPVITIIFAWVLLLPLTIRRKLITKKGLVLMLIGSAVALTQLFLDPFNLIEWLLD